MQTKTNQARVNPACDASCQRISEKVHAINDMAHQTCRSASSISQILFSAGKQFDEDKPDPHCLEDELNDIAHILMETIDILTATADRI